MNSLPKSRPGLKLNVNPSTLQPGMTTQVDPLEAQLRGFGNIQSADLKLVNELGAGNGGVVSKVIHIPTQIVMARKVIPIENNPTIRKNIMTELNTLKKCQSEYIVSSYGAFIDEGNVSICMEFMDVGSLDRISKLGPIPEQIIGSILDSVLRGLVYLYEIHRIIHRDIKPSNILFNSFGQVKICDFGVSRQLTNSIANSFVGTSSYMAPERIQGTDYTVHSDVWSLGLTIIELATGKFPYPSNALTFFELLELIVSGEPPSLPQSFSPDFRDIISKW
ncbi:Protein kinase, catalytic domain-containing protein [Rozella allomycis CSF55]|uniref:mitogen-activated protein kinase kinase n=1 Tax=Rozella allomycis (strain CSF55) TaxID=988480 RepID=A0A075AY01_ROZAC|nr:Protein kinase, catalytic domain-containing protein [Rozella allomycis CSF55]|eukprot:EPZ33572.1 Protein kinase, catalytic domain-containing protein [Rozella allomycis CSF55]